MGDGKIFRRGQVTGALAGLRLDQGAAALFPDFSRSRLQSWTKSGELKLNSKSAKQGERLRAGDEIEIRAAWAADDELAAENMELDIRYRDEHLLIVNKPKNLVVHPAAGHRAGTLLNGLLHAHPELAPLPRAGIIHRLDKDTSGLMLIARTPGAHRELVARLQERRIERVYRAIVCGAVTAGGSIDQPVGRHPTRRKQMAVVANGKPARTHYRVLQRFGSHSLLDVKLETGRTHQIRVHLAWLGYPLIGDPAYSGRPRSPPNCAPELTAALRGFGRQALHAGRLSLAHPISGETITLEADLPADMSDLLAMLVRHDQPPAGRGHEPK